MSATPQRLLVIGVATAVLTAAAAEANPIQCEREGFASHLDLKEGSGATWLGSLGGLLVVSDSDNDGAYVLVSPRGKLIERGRLPRGPSTTSDDLEGVSRIGNVVYGLTSGGWVRQWVRRRGKFVLRGGPYPIGKKDNVCRDAASSNCGPNYEGMCLRAKPPGNGCAGFAVSKTNGTLVCIRRSRRGRLRVDPKITIPITGGDRLSGCDFSSDGSTLVVGTNIFDLNRIYTVRGFDTPGGIDIRTHGPLGQGFGEAIGIDESDNVYRISDTATSRSGADKFRCTGLSRSPR